MNVVDLFSGCGGMSLGFQQAGFNIICAFDNWKPAINIYEANFAHRIVQMDLGQPEAIPLITEVAPDIIIGGPPCQDYSIAGKRTVGTRANLTIRFAEIVAAVRPEWVVFENVYNIERFSNLSQMKTILSDAGYGLSATILDASRCGVPQKRRRFFLVGKLGETDGFLDYLLEARLTSKQMTVRDHLGDSLDTQYYYMHPRSYKRRAVFSIDEPAATIRGINRPIPDNYRPHHGDKAAIDEGVRALTTQERSYIQTFPVGFQLPGAKTDVELAIGNAVPPKLARYVAEAITAFGATERISGENI